MSQQPSQKKASTLRAVIYLTVTALIAVALLANVERLTRQRINANEAARIIKRLQAVLPAEGYDNEPYLDAIRVPPHELLGSTAATSIYRARRSGQPVAAVLTATALDGYFGQIRMLVSIDANGRVFGVRVIAHNETPGLGDAIDIQKSDWIENLNGLMVTENSSSDWVLKRDGGNFDRITGATVTSRAVIDSVRNAVIYFNDNRDEIFLPSPQNSIDTD